LADDAPHRTDAEAKLTDAQITDARRRVSAGVPKTTIARDLSIDRTTLYRMLATPPSPTEEPLG
jgi:DNA invertase Pin-like site-specific DNA recombinase